MTVRAEVSEYVVDVLTPECGDWGTWRLTVQRVWQEGMEVPVWGVVRHGSLYLGRDGSWEWRNFEPELHGFPREEALRLAEEKVWTLVINGKTAADVIREWYPKLEGRIPGGT